MRWPGIAEDRSAAAAMPSRPWFYVVAGLVALFGVYYGLVGWMSERIDPDLTLRPPPSALPPGGSVTVAMAATLMTRELEAGWTPNDTIFATTALLDNMPAWQTGVRGSIAPLVAVLGDDPDIRSAGEALATPPDRWWLHGGWPFVGGAAESAYRDAVAGLVRFNAMASAQGFDRSPARLTLVLDQIALRLGTVSAATDRTLRDRRTAGDLPVDEQFFAAKGTAYTLTILLRALRDDHAALIRERQLGGALNIASEALDSAAMLDPLAVSTDDLMRQGYHLLVARNQIRDLTARLQATP